MNSLVTTDPYAGAIIGESGLSPSDLAALERAIRELEGGNLAMRLTAMFGRQVGLLGAVVPGPVAEAANRAAEAAIKSAMALALRSLEGQSIRDRRYFHKVMAVTAGAAGGALGIPGLPIELPIVTTIMLRAIADIARSEGEDLSHPRAAFACLEVFAFGGRAEAGRVGLQNDESIETGYFAVRGILAKSVTEAARYLLDRGLLEETAPALVRLIAQISSRFGLVLSQKLAAQSVPVIGGLCGAGINYAFVDHFQRLARGHFTVRRLERTYGAVLVRAEYDRLLNPA